MALDSLISTFVVEARERLEEMEYLLVRFKDEGDDESINAIFRAAHTIKGSGGLFGLSAIVSFAHTMEEALDMARDGRLVIDEALTTLLLQCCDFLSGQFDALERDDLPETVSPHGRSLMQQLVDRCLGRAPSAPAAPAARPPSAPAEPVINEDVAEGALFAADGGLEPWITAPVWTAESDAIRGVGALFGADGELEPWIPSPSDMVYAPALPDISAFLAPSPVMSPNRPEASGASGPGSSFSVDVARVDEWVDGLSELLIMASSMSHAIRAGDLPLAGAQVEKLTTLVQELRDGALSLRTLELGAVFDEVAAEARDLAASAGKSVDIEVVGGDTRLDHVVVAALVEPLRHVLVNAVEHGVGDRSRRKAAGKPERAVIRVSAVRDASSVVVEIADDGFGLDRERILAKGRAYGLCGPQERPSNAEIDRFIFAEGFTTRDGDVRDGLDTVYRDVTALKGSLQVRTVPGSGTVFTLRLPLTQSVVHGFQVEVASSRFIIPVSWIEECVAMEVSSDMKYTLLRGRVLPLIHVGGLLGQPSEGARQVVVSRVDGQIYGIVVDSLHGLLHTVVRPLGEFLGTSEWISGTTILPDGQIGLILDAPELVRHAESAAA